MKRVLIGTEAELDTCHADDYYKADVIIRITSTACVIVKCRGCEVLEGARCSSIREALDRWVTE